MKLLIDNALSPVVARMLREAGHDAKHVRDLHLEAAPDQIVLDRAQSDGRVIVSADTDFGALLALRESASPSFILFRKTRGVRPVAIGEFLRSLVTQYGDELETGCIITVSDDRVRIRTLPIG